MRNLRLLLVMLAFIPVFAYSTTDSLLHVLKTAKDTARLQVLAYLAEEYIFEGKMDDAEKCINQALNENDRIKNKSATVYIGLKNVLYYYKKSAFRLSNKLCEDILPLALELKNEVWIAQCKSYMGMNTGRLGDFKRALEFYHEALPVFEKTNDYLWQTKLYSSIAGVYFDQLDYSTAIEYFTKTLSIAIHRNDKKIIGQSYNNIGSSWQSLGNDKKAKEFYLQAVKINTESNNLSNLAYNYMNLASCELAENNTDLAEEFNKKAMDIFVGFKDLYSVVGCMCVDADIYMQRKNYKKAVDILKQAVVMAEKTGSPLVMERTYQQMAAAFEKNGDYKNSVLYYKKFIITKDSIINEEIRGELTKKQMQFEYDKKRMADSLEASSKEKFFHQEIESNKRKAQLQRNISIISLISLVIVAVLSFFIYVALQRNKKARKLIEEQKIMVDAKNKEIVDSINYAKKIQQSLMPSDKYLSKNLERLKNDKV